MRTRFQQGLDELKQKLLRMGGMAEQAVDRAIRAYRTRDVDLCRVVLSAENAINDFEREIDELALDLLAMQQPMAVDLRFIVAVVKINSDLERVGDQAVNIAERSIELATLPPADLPLDISRMGDLAANMVRTALGSFIEGRVDLAQQVLESDNLLDRMNLENFEIAMRSIGENPAIARQAVDTHIISRNLERVGDHATNIAEDVIFWIRGADVRHGHNVASGQ
jgi:phosphate transport system protein